MSFCDERFISMINKSKMQQKYIYPNPLHVDANADKDAGV